MSSHHSSEKLMSSMYIHTGALPQLKAQSTMSIDVDTVYAMARSLMDAHGLKDWKLRLNTRTSSAGLCYFDTKTIALSTVYIKHRDATIDILKNIVLHEIAHALVGKAHGHDAVWRAKALEIGCDGKRCTVLKNERTPKNKYLISCECHKAFRDRLCGKMKNVHGQKCRRCHTTISVTEN